MLIGANERHRAGTAVSRADLLITELGSIREVDPTPGALQYLERVDREPILLKLAQAVSCIVTCIGREASADPKSD